MSVTIEELKVMLDAFGLKYKAHNAKQIGMGFGTKQYRDKDGDENLVVILELSEDGEYFKAYAPNAFSAKGDHVDAFLRACMILQWRTKLVQFEFDPGDGEIRPIVEFPIEDGKVTEKQLKRCIMGLVGLLDEYYPALKRVLDTGIIDLLDSPRLPPGSASVMAQMLLASLKAGGSPDTDPQVVAVRKIIEDLDRAASSGPPTSV